MERGERREESPDVEKWVVTEDRKQRTEVSGQGIVKKSSRETVVGILGF